MPAHEGTKIGCVGRGKGSGVACAPQRSPGWGTSPSATFLLRPSGYSSTTRRFISWIRGGNLSRTVRFIDGQWPPPVPCSSQAA